MKVTIYRRLPIMKIMVLLWSTSVVKDSNIVPSLFFSHFLGLLFFWPFSFFPHMGQCSNNENHRTSIYLQLKNYNSILEQNMTLCECLRRCTGMCNESRVICIKNDDRWLCHKYDVNYMIMRSNITMLDRVIVNGMVVSCMAIYLGMAMEMPW